MSNTELTTTNRMLNAYVPHEIFPDLNSQNKPIDTIENCEALLEYLGVITRHNRITRETEILIPNERFDSQNSVMAAIKSALKRNRVPTESYIEYINFIARKNEFCPIRTYLENLLPVSEEEGRNAFEWVCNTIKHNEDEAGYLAFYLKKWLIQCVALPLNDKTKGASCLTLVGEQSAGKTQWLVRLAPAILQEYVAEGVHLDPDNKDSVIAVCSKWIVELGELDGIIKKVQVESLKNFITRLTDELRKPYERMPEKWKRRTSCCASVNSDQFLRDKTGNRRFFCVKVESCDWKALETEEGQKYLNAMWYWIYQCYLNGESWHLTKEETQSLNERNEEFEEHDPWQDLILTKFNFDSNDRKFISTPEVLEIIGDSKCGNSEAKRLATIMKKMDIEQSRPKKGKSRVSGYLLPPKIGQVFGQGFY